MNHPTKLQTHMIRLLTHNEFMAIPRLAAHCNVPEHEVSQVLEKWRETDYAVEVDNGQWTLTR